MKQLPLEYPLITVVTVVYNTGEFVVRGLETLLNQNYPKEKVQHLIIDDFSTDNSVELIEKWIQNHHAHSCTFIKHEKNFGLCKSLNDGLRLSIGKYFSVMADDLWKPERLRICIAEFEKLSEEYSVLHTPVDICDENDVIISRDVGGKSNGTFPDEFTELLTSAIHISATSSIYRTSTLREMSGFDERLTFEDVDLLLRMCGKYKFYLLNNSLSIYRKNLSQPNSMSDKARRSFDFVLDMMKMNANAIGQSREHDDLLLSIYLDELEIWYVMKYNKSFSIKRAKRYHTLMTRFLLKSFRDNRQFSKYYSRLFSLLFFKKYSPYSARDIFFLAKKYFDKDFAFV